MVMDVAVDSVAPRVAPFIPEEELLEEGGGVLDATKPCRRDVQHERQRGIVRDAAIVVELKCSWFASNHTARHLPRGDACAAGVVLDGSFDGFQQIQSS